jgi:hypothetical protein
MTLATKKRASTAGAVSPPKVTSKASAFGYYLDLLGGWGVGWKRLWDGERGVGWREGGVWGGRGCIVGMEGGGDGGGWGMIEKESLQLLFNFEQLQ